MTCRAQTGFLHHDLDFSQPTPMDFALCRRCGDYVTKEQWAAWRCEGTPGPVACVQRESGDLACALCGEPIVVDPMHRAIVQFFGSVCNECAATTEVARV